MIEVFPTGGMLWHYRWQVSGRPQRVTLGRYPALSLRMVLPTLVWRSELMLAR